MLISQYFFNVVATEPDLKVEFNLGLVHASVVD